MTRLVLDTNVIVSGLLFGGAAGRLLERLWTGRFRLAASPEILSEYRRVLTCPAFTLKPAETRRLMETYLLPFCDIVRAVTGSAVCRDSDDDKFLYCALAARARALVTGDRDILILGPAFRGIPILTVRQALQEFAD
jgi:putative PIN family toxin of toxin-antitoxin system